MKLLASIILLLTMPLIAAAADVTNLEDGADASTMQEIIDGAEQAGGGLVSWEGTSPIIDNQIVMKKHVSLRGWSDERTPMRQATANSDGTANGIPNTSLKITYGKDEDSSADNAAFVINSNSGGLNNTLISYPEQVTSGSAPIKYSPTIGIVDKVGYTLRNLQFLNSYIWLKAEGKNGIATIENISGTPFCDKCFWLDRIAEATLIKNVTAWKYGGSDSDKNDLSNYINSNSTLFYLGQVDALTIDTVSSYNVKTTFHLYNNGKGAPWVNISNFHSDNNIQPIIIDGVNVANFTNGVLIGDVENYMDGHAGIEITDSVKEPAGRANFTNIDCYNMVNCVWIKAGMGQFNFYNVTAKTDTKAKSAGRYDGNKVSGALLIDEGNGAVVNMFNAAQGGREVWSHIFGSGETLKVDGITLPNRDKEITPQGWDKKDNWANNQNISEIKDGLQFNMASDVAAVTFPLGAEISSEGIAVAEFTLKQSFAKKANSKTKFDVSFINSEGKEITKMFDAGVVPHFEQGVKYIFPFFTDTKPDSKIQIKFGGASGDASISLTGFKVWRPSRQYLTNSYFDAVYGTARYSNVSGRIISMKGSNKSVVASAPPADGSWINGDEVINSTISSGSAYGWKYVSGKWKKFGVVE